jgi:hypothetical protein
MMEIDAPRHRARQEIPVFRVRGTAGEGNGRAGSISGTKDRSFDSRSRNIIVRHRQDRSSAAVCSQVVLRIDYPLVIVAVVDYEYYYEVDIAVALVAGDAVPIVAVLGYRLLD